MRMDALYVAMAIAFFVLCVLYVEFLSGERK